MRREFDPLRFHQMKCTWHLCENETDTKFCSTKCKSKYHVTKRRRKLKEQAVEYKDGTCQCCEYDGTKCADVMEFHHLDPREKDFSIGQDGKTRAWARIQAEIDKCVMLCCRCHREVHAGVRTIPL
jgi:hypothetical protein